jgi:hypothetical protein
MWAAPPEFGAAEFGAAGTAGAAPVVFGAAGAGRTVDGFPWMGEAEPPCAWAEATAKIAALAIKATDVFRMSRFLFFTIS